MAWGYYEFTEDLYSGETVEEWISLSGKQGDEKEGNVNLILSLQVLRANRKHMSVFFEFVRASFIEIVALY